MLIGLYFNSNVFVSLFLFLDTGIQVGWQQQFKTQRQREGSGFRHGELEEDQSSLQTESNSEYTSHKLFITTGKLNNSFFVI